jgi:hypothetical protein
VILYRSNTQVQQPERTPWVLRGQRQASKAAPATATKKCNGRRQRDHTHLDLRTAVRVVVDSQRPPQAVVRGNPLSPRIHGYQQQRAKREESQPSERLLGESARLRVQSANRRQPTDATHSPLRTGRTHTADHSSSRQGNLR